VAGAVFLLAILWIFRENAIRERGVPAGKGFIQNTL
jgi:hypothetical protein